MSRKKGVEQEYLQRDVPAPTEGQRIAMSLGSRGGNTMEVQFANGSSTLCLLPSKFNKKLWIRKGGLVVVEETVLEATDAKVTGSIVHVLYPDQIKALRRRGVDIPDFGCAAAAAAAIEAPEAPQPEGHDSDSDAGSLPDVHVNPNLVHRPQYSGSDSD